MVKKVQIVSTVIIYVGAFACGIAFGRDAYGDFNFWIALLIWAGGFVFGSFNLALYKIIELLEETSSKNAAVMIAEPGEQKKEKVASLAPGVSVTREELEARQKINDQYWSEHAKEKEELEGEKKDLEAQKEILTKQIIELETQRGNISKDEQAATQDTSMIEEIDKEIVSIREQRKVVLQRIDEINNELKRAR